MRSNENQDADIKVPLAETLNQNSKSLQDSEEILVRRTTGKSLVISVNFGTTQINAVLDTAAEVTILKTDVAKKLGIPYNSGKKFTLKTAAEQQDMKMEAYLVPNVKFKIQNKNFKTDILVAPIADEMLLGLQFFKEHKSSIDISNTCLYLDGMKIEALISPAQGSDPYSVSQVSISETVSVPPKSIKFISIHLNQLPVPASNEILIEPINTNPDILVPYAVVKSDLRVPISLLNLTDKTVKMHRDQVVARAVAIDAILPEPSSKSGSTLYADNLPQEEGSPLLDDILSSVQKDMPDHIKDLFKRSGEGLSKIEKIRLGRMLLYHEIVFAKHDLDLGCFRDIKHPINTADNPPSKHKMRKTPLHFQKEEEDHIKKLLEIGVIRPSTSEWASAPVLIRKKDGSVRWCVDYRDLNNRTVKDNFPLPNIQDCLDSLAGSTFFSTLDMASGYYQIELEESDKKKTAIVTRYGLFEHNRMGFGLCNAPATFQRAIQLVLTGLTWKQALAYLDDVNVLGKGFDDHIKNVDEVLHRFRSYNLKLKPKKCFLFRRQVAFLGKLCSRDGIQIAPEKLSAVQKWTKPKCKKDVESFLGFANYHREHIKGYADMARCLYDLTGKAEFHWIDDHDLAFNRLKEALTSAPCLAYPLPEATFILDTDASKYAIGAELSQVQNGVERTIAYASNILLPAQKRYCVTRKELLAVVKFTDQFRHYLLGKEFILRTDHHSLVWLFRFQRLEGQLARWQEVLSQFQPKIIHRPGGKHINADGLSRIPDDLPSCNCYTAGANLEDLPCGGCSYCTRAHGQWDRFCEDVDDVLPLAIRAVTLQNVQAPSEDQNASSSGDESVNSSLTSLPPDFPLLDETVQEEANRNRKYWLPAYTSEELRKYQLEDPDINVVIRWLEKEEVPLSDVLFLSSPATKILWIHRLQLRLINEILYYLWDTKPDRRVCLVVPEQLRKEVLSACHDNKTAGHLGQNKTLLRVKRSFWWPHMTDDCNVFVQQCPICGKCKTPSNPPRAALRKHHAGFPMERVHLDVLGPFVKSALGNKYILVMVDQFTKWVDAAAIPEQSAETVALKFIDYMVSPLGLPIEIHTDQGSNFESSLFKAFCRKFEIAKTRTTPYHPSSNGQVERFNRTLLPMIRSYIEGKQQYWDRDLSLLMVALHSTVNRQTGFTPNRLMLGREVFQPADLLFETATVNGPQETAAQWAQTIKDSLIASHRLVRERLSSTQAKQKRDYDLKKVKEFTFSPGDIVWKRRQARTKGKSSKLETPNLGPYVILKARMPIFTIQGQKREEVVHHDKLVPCLSSQIPLWIRKKRHELFDLDDTLECEDASTVSTPHRAESSNSTLPGNLEGSLDLDSSNTQPGSALGPSDSFPCGICHQEVLDEDDAIMCDGDCSTWFHLDCTDLSRENFLRLSESTSSPWICHGCLHQNSLSSLNSDDLPNLFALPDQEPVKRPKRTSKPPAYLRDYTS